ncbi:DinB family protein [Pedobacter endophyticus]|uniref:DinB family protein n=1 Tax=Pedobacter endophyticus TaxID=2789740 RepID=A0A7U3Q6K4_9SPHI|nr:DinB family protein [Pedobacter endophyticus]QPH38857.1 DinB family protein [Pedobacter endophyticus]
MFNITNEIKKGFNGDAWHGNHVMQTLNNVKPENAFEHYVPNAHSIAEIALHLTAWTEEVTSRIMGNQAAEPAMGDWPIPEAKTPQAWEKIIFNFKLANEELIRHCELVKPNEWNDDVNMERNRALGTGVTKIELLNGLVQHHAYHSGQIALLSKF